MSGDPAVDALLSPLKRGTKDYLMKVRHGGCWKHVSPRIAAGCCCPLGKPPKSLNLRRLSPCFCSFGAISLPHLFNG